MNDVKCPHCGTKQKNKPTKSWPYGRKIKKEVAGKTKLVSCITCYRYVCKCEKSFLFYLTTRNTSWTIPKPKTE